MKRERKQIKRIRDKNVCVAIDTKKFEKKTLGHKLRMYATKLEKSERNE